MSTAQELEAARARIVELEAEVATLKSALNPPSQVKGCGARLADGQYYVKCGNPFLCTRCGGFLERADEERKPINPNEDAT